MAVLTFRLANNTVNSFGELIEADQAALTLGTGWIVAKLNTPNSSDMDWGSERAANTFSSNSTTPKPTALDTSSPFNALRSTNPITGVFANTNWSISITLRSVTAVGGTVRARVRVYRSANADGSGATELTGATQIGTTTAALSTSVDRVSTVTWAPGGTLTFDNEYLFIVVALEIVTAGGSNSSDALLQSGSSPTVGTRVITPDLVTNYTDAATIYLALTPSGSESQEFVEAPYRPFIGRGKPYESDSTDSSGGSLDLNDSNIARAQEIVASENGTVTRISLALGKSGTPTGTVTIELCADNSNKPGAVLASGTISASSLSTASARYTVDISPTSIVAGTKYWLLVRYSITSGISFPIVSLVSQSLAQRGFTGNIYQWTISTQTLSNGTASGFTFNLLEYTGAGVVYLTLTPSGTDVYETGGGGTETTDAATVYLSFTPSGTEERVSEDAQTVSLAFTPSGTDILQAIDNDTVILSFVPSGAEVREQVDAGTVSLSLTPSAAELLDTIDAETVLFAFMPSGTEVRERVDTGDITLQLSASSSSEIAEFADTDTILLTFTPSGADVQESSAADSATVSFLLTPTGADVAAYIEADTVLLVLTPSGAEAAAFTESATIPLAFTPASIEIQEAVDDATATLQFTPSGTAVSEFVDSAITTIALTPSGTDTIQAVESATAYLTLQPSGEDQLLAQGSDAATIPVVVLPSGAETAQFTESAETRITLTPSGAEEYSQVFQDTGTLDFALTPSGVEGAETAYEDAETATIALTPASLDVVTYVDSGTGVLTFTPSGTSTAEFDDIATIPFELTPSGSDEYEQIFEYVDAATIYLRLTPVSIALLSMVLSSKAIARWSVRFSERTWKSRGYRNWSTHELQ